MNENRPIQAEEILKFLPHRFPIFLVDRVISVDTKGDHEDLENLSGKVGSTVHALKLISMGDPIFQGHFPGRPIFPGVMTLEALAQTACFTMYSNVLAHRHEIDIRVALIGFDGVRYRAPVIPGDVLQLHTKVLKVKKRIFVFEARAEVDGKLVCEAEIMAQIEFVKKG